VSRATTVAAPRGVEACRMPAWCESGNFPRRGSFPAGAAYAQGSPSGPLPALADGHRAGDGVDVDHRAVIWRGRSRRHPASQGRPTRSHYRTRAGGPQRGRPHPEPKTVASANLPASAALIDGGTNWTRTAGRRRRMACLSMGSPRPISARRRRSCRPMSPRRPRRPRSGAWSWRGGCPCLCRDRSGTTSLEPAHRRW